LAVEIPKRSRLLYNLTKLLYYFALDAGKMLTDRLQWAKLLSETLTAEFVSLEKGSYALEQISIQPRMSL